MTLEEAVKKDLNTALSELVQQAFWTGYKAATDKIVRCKDCKYWQDNNGGYPTYECKWRTDETSDADDFCSMGERKEEC